MTVLLNLMASGLRLPSSYLTSLARGSSHRYKTYSIPKRSSPGLRVIHHPSRRLKAVQRWLVGNIIAKLPVHDAAFGYRKNRSTLDNAQAHASQNFLLRLDIANFFESIRVANIEALLLNNVGLLPQPWTHDDTQLFCALVCKNGALTIGAPSSPGLSNAVMFSADASISGHASSLGVRYTRYADDLFFSTISPNVLGSLSAEVDRILQAGVLTAGLRLNPAKVRHTSRKRTRRVTGLVLTPQGGISIGRDQKRKLSAMIHQFGSLTTDDKKYLAGWLAYCQSVEPDFVNRLYSKYGSKRVDDAKRHA